MRCSEKNKYTYRPKMKKKRRLNIKRILIVVILFALIIVGAVLAIQKLTHKEEKVTEVKEVAAIEAYGYTLKENATAYYKKLFKYASI